jgi:hypothetical protein
MDELTRVCQFIVRYRAEHPDAQKDEIAAATAQRFGLKSARKTYVGRDFAIRFSHASSASFSNVVLSLSALRPFDDRPFVVCVVRPSAVEFLLANTTFLKKISHSSHQLRVDNVRGSFLGHDIVRRYGSLENQPENFATLFAAHREHTWEDNLRRLVSATDEIVGTVARMVIDPAQERVILSAADLAAEISTDPEYLAIAERLAESARVRSADILAAAAIDNVNLRGNRIEQIISDAGNFHRLDDLVFSIRRRLRVLVDIKTKVLTLQSNPKGFNIDKYLRTLAEGNTLISFFFVGIDPGAREVRTGFASTLDEMVINATHVQFHWAGRNSRGVTQLTRDMSAVFAPGFRERVEAAHARVFLQELMEL